MHEVEPQTYKKAVAQKKSLIEKILKVKLTPLCINHSWEVVDLPPENKSLSSRKVFTKKMEGDCTIDKYTARLVLNDIYKKKVYTILTPTIQ